MGTCGTLCINRQLVPDAIKQAKPKKGNPCVFDKDRRLQYMVWQDKKKVSLVTSLYDDRTFTKCVKDKNAETMSERL